jgi:hypothetical protein
MRRTVVAMTIQYLSCIAVVIHVQYAGNPNNIISAGKYPQNTNDIIIIYGTLIIQLVPESIYRKTNNIITVGNFVQKH